METRLVVPQLQPFYRWAEPLSWALIRITAGLMLIPHGWPKLMMGVGRHRQHGAGEARHPARRAARGRSLIAIETIGGLCIALGLFTRFWAAAATIEMSVIVYHHLPKFGWTDRGYEYPLFWGLVMLAIALRGGGPYSLDRRIGREL